MTPSSSCGRRSFDGDKLTFDVDVLERLGGADGPASIFIDIIGRPLTPFSFAGAARRTAYRAAWYRGAAGRCSRSRTILLWAALWISAASTLLLVERESNLIGRRGKPAELELVRPEDIDRAEGQRCNHHPVRVYRECEHGLDSKHQRTGDNLGRASNSRYDRFQGFGGTLVGLMEATPSAWGPIPTGTSTRPISILELIFQRPRSQPRVTFSMSSLNSNREVTRGRLTRSGMTPRVTDWPAYISKPSHSRSLR